MKPDVQRGLLKHIISHPRVWHIGMLRWEDKSWHSHDGGGISVSLDPAAWRSIAHLRGPLYCLEKERAAFVDGYRCLTLMQPVWQWALHERYVERRRLYRVQWRESGVGSRHRMSFLARRRAREEYQGLLLAGVCDVRASIFFGYVPTEKMRVRMHHTSLPLAFVRDFALSLYMEDHCAEVDGIWWEDVADLASLSAPHGMIFSRQLRSWGGCRVWTPSQADPA